MPLSSFLLQTICPALLPAADAVDFEYYDVLGLNKNDATNSTKNSIACVRKAYKLKSLQLHPDKIAQKKGNGSGSGHGGHGEDAAAAAALYERVQEAAAVLSDEHKRRLYHSFGCSVARYRFVVTQQGLSNPVALHDHLQRASCADKTRLVLLTVVLLGLLLTQPILVAAKVNGIFVANALSHCSWLIVLIPCWVVGGLYVVILAVTTVVVAVQKSKSKATTTAAAKLLEDADVTGLLWQWTESVAVLVGLVLLALQLDRTVADKHNWHFTALPFYVAVLLRIGSHLWLLSKLRRAQAIMVSPEFLQRTEGIDMFGGGGGGGDTAAVEDDETKRDEISARYIVVQSSEAAVAAILEQLRKDESSSSSSSATHTVTEEDVEAIRVQCSEEWQAVESATRPLHRSVGSLILVYISFIALTAAKLQGQIEQASWWVVFIPIWISLGLPFLQHFSSCCCAGGNLHPEPDVEVVQVNFEGGTTAGDNEEGGTASTKDPHSGSSMDDQEQRAAKLGSVKWASPEGDMEDFNSESKRAFHADFDTAAKAAVQHDTVETSTTNPKPTFKVDNGNDDNDKGGRPEDMDEETFRRWEQEMHADESAVIEQKFKGLVGCCWFCFQIVILCLVVAKLEYDYENAVIDGNTSDGGYSAFWILFPIFLVSGVILCCCSFCIYARERPADNSSPPGTFTNETKPTEATTTTEAQAPSSIIPATPATAEAAEPSLHDPSTGTAVEESASGHHADSVTGETKASQDIEAGGKMDDLD